MSRLSAYLYMKVSALYKAENQEVDNKIYMYIHIQICVFFKNFTSKL